MNHSRRSRLTATSISQVITSVGNLVLPLTVARTSPGTSHFAHFSVAFSVLSLLLMAVRLTSGDYLRIAYPESKEPLLEIAWAKTRAIRLGLMGLGASVGLWAVGWPSRTPLILVAGLVGVCVAAAESSRSTLIACGRPGDAVRIDLVWTIPTVVGALALATSGVLSPSAYLAVWGAGAALAAVVSVIREPFTLTMQRPRSDPDPARRAQRSVLWKEFVVLRGGNQAMYLGSATLGGAGVVATLAAGELTNRPLRFLNQLALAAGVPEASRLRANRVRLARLASRIALLLAVIGGTWWGLLIVGPHFLLESLLGNSAPLLDGVMLPFAALGVASALQAAARVAIHGMNAVQPTLVGQTIVNVVSIGVTLAFAARGSLVGVAWTLAVSTFASFLILVWVIRVDRGADRVSSTESGSIA